MTNYKENYKQTEWEILYRLPTTGSKVYTTHIDASSEEDALKDFQTEHSNAIRVGNIKRSPIKLFPIKEQCFLEHEKDGVR